MPKGAICDHELEQKVIYTIQKFYRQQREEFFPTGRNERTIVHLIRTLELLVITEMEKENKDQEAFFDK